MDLFLSRHACSRSSGWDSYWFATFSRVAIILQLFAMPTEHEFEGWQSPSDFE